MGCIEQSQRNAARLVGLTFLVTNALAAFAEFQVRDKLIDYTSAAKTVANIAGSQHLFRLGLAAELFTYACDVILAVGLYVILRSVNRNIALFGMACRLVETALVAMTPLCSLVVLRLLSGAPYMKAIDPVHMQGMVRLALDAHDAGSNVAFLFFGMGSMAFSYLFLRSGYIPRILAALGIVGSIIAGASTFVYALSPTLAGAFEPACFIPIGLFELGLGLWLLFKGLAPPGLG